MHTTSTSPKLIFFPLWDFLGIESGVRKKMSSAVVSFILATAAQAPQQAQQLVTATAVAVPNLTPCQRCCAPGGDCSAAYKGTPGKCCGVVNGQAFCCPGVAAQGAKCYSCADSFRCYTGFAARNICGGAMPVPSAGHSHRLPPPRYNTYYERQGGDGGVTQMLIFMAICGVMFVLCCSRRAHDYHDGAMMPHGHMAPVGVPVGPGGYPLAGGMYPVGGYSGMSTMGSAATGFLGGMLVSDMMHSSHHHGGGDYGGSYGGYSGGGDYGGDYGGGGDFGGGGDCGFSSDS